MLGFETLAGNTRVRTATGLVRLDQLGANPDLSGVYTKNEIDTQLLFKQHIISSTAGSGTEVWDSNMIRRLVGGSNVTLSLDSNGNIVVDSTGGSGIPSTIATFEATGINLKAVTTISSMNTFMITAGTVRSSTFEGIGSDVSLSGINSAIVACTDTNGTCAVASRCRTGQEGVHITTSTTNADVCLQNTTT